VRARCAATVPVDGVARGSTRLGGCTEAGLSTGTRDSSALAQRAATPNPWSE